MTHGLAQEPRIGVLEDLRLLKEETVVTAIRHEQPISQAPSNTYVITDEDIRHSGATDLPTLLRRIPGIEVMQTTGADFNVSARGDNQILSNKMLVLVDGRSVYIDSQAFVFWKALPVTLPEIKRIEVIKGPVSAVHGFNAFDGIINIITKSPQEVRGTTVQIAGGELGTTTNSAIYGNTHGHLGYRLSAGWDQNQQWRNRDSLAFRAYRFNGQLEYALDASSKLLVSGGIVDMNRFDGPLQRAVNLSSSVDLPYANLAYERPNFFLRAWWSQFDATSLTVTDPALAGLLLTTDSAGSSRLNFLGNTYNIEGQHAVKLGASHRLTYGVNFRHNTFSGNSLSNSDRENRLGLYVQDEWQTTDRLRVTAGVRYDLDTFINPTVSPRGALIYQPVPDQTFRLTISMAFRPPTLFETNLSLVSTPLPSGTPIPLQGSANLSPEQIISYELGYQGWFYRHRLRLRADLFFNHISDLIDLTQVSPTLFTTANGGEADIYGGEAGFELLAASWLTLFGNYSYQELGQTFSGTFRRGTPRFKFNIGARGEWENGLSSEVMLHYVGAAVYPISEFFSQLASEPPNTRVGSYALLSLRLAYRFWQERAEVAFSAYNALNDKHKEHPLGDTIGSRVMGWITVKY